MKIVEHDGFEHIELAEELSAGAGVDCEGAEMTDLVKAKCGHFVRVVRGPYSRNYFRQIRLCPDCQGIDDEPERRDAKPPSAQVPAGVPEVDHERV